MMKCIGFYIKIDLQFYYRKIYWKMLILWEKFFCERERYIIFKIISSRLYVFIFKIKICFFFIFLNDYMLLSQGIC